MKSILYIPALLLLTFLTISCGPERLDDYSDVSYELTDQNGEKVVFPDDFRGSPLIVGFIYTNCPDICSFITANVGNIYNEMDDPGNAQFALITFDPRRDTPEVLKRYANSFGMDREPFHFLTADSTTIDSLMKRVSVRVKESYSQELESGQRAYFLNHSDKILLIDGQSRLVFDYGGSMTSPEIIIEDLQKL